MAQAIPTKETGNSLTADELNALVADVETNKSQLVTAIASASITAVEVVSVLPGLPDANTLYIVTGA